MNAVSITRQIAAIEALIAIVEGRKAKPRPSQVEMIIADARAALDALRTAARDAG